MSYKTQLRIERFVRITLAVALVLGTYAPGIASAQALYSRPGSGASRLPLNVMTFGAAGFGDVSDAINLANGNVFVNVAGLSRNSQDEVTEAETDLFNSWHMDSRYQLHGFNSELSLAPEAFFMGMGDGSGINFLKQNEYSFDDAPSWIKRYEDNANAYIYTLAPQRGVQYVTEWLVLALEPGQNAVAHYFTTEGVRYTFMSDGDYLDFTQNLHQQVRAANAGYPDGAQASEGARTTPRTELIYLADALAEPATGRLKSVTDEYGRTVRYFWKGDSGKIDKIGMLLKPGKTGNNIADYLRQVSFTYGWSSNAQTNNLIETVTFITGDGFGGSASRNIQFEYDEDDRVASIKRPVGSDQTLITKYEYDGNNRVELVKQLDAKENPIQTETRYTYDPRNPGITPVQHIEGDLTGLKVLITQGDKKSLYEYNESSQLRRMSVLDKNPDSEQKRSDQVLTWEYQYYPDGSTAAVIHPTGKTEQFAYDPRNGKLTQANTYEFVTPNPNAAKDTPVVLSLSTENDQAGVNPGATLKITPGLANAETNSGVRWFATAGQIDAAGVYTAPTEIPEDETVTITAISNEDMYARQDLELSIRALGLTLTTPDVNELNAGATLELNATAENNFANLPILYSATAGSFDGNVYTAPYVDTNTEVTLSAGFEGSDASDSFTLTVKPTPVYIEAASTELTSVETLQLSAEVQGDPENLVTWEVISGAGSVDASGLFIPALNFAPEVITVRAVSTVNPQASSDIALTVTPEQFNLLDLQDQSFSSSQGFLVDASSLRDADATPLEWTSNLPGELVFKADDAEKTQALVSLTDVSAGEYSVTVSNPNVADSAKTVTFTLNGSSAQLNLLPAALSALAIATPKTANLILKAAPLLQTLAIGEVISNEPSVYITEAPASIASGASAQLSATVRHDASNAGITWSAPEGMGSVSASGVYTAPIVSEDLEVTLTATSKADPKALSQVFFTVKATEIKITDAPAVLSSGQSHSFAAELVNDVNAAGVVWSTDVGTIAANGTYTAPVVAEDTVVKVTATSAAAPGAVTSYTFTLKAVDVKITDGPASLQSGEPFAFASEVLDDVSQSGVSWTASSGVIEPDGRYTAPVVAEDEVVTVTATSNAAPSVASSYTFSVQAVDLRVTDAPETLQSGEPFSFTASLKNDFAEQGYVWSVPEGVGTITPTGQYTAPIVAAPVTVPVTVTSLATPDVSSTVHVEVRAVNLEITNAPASLDSAEPFTFGARLTDDYTQQGYVWSVPEGMGTIDQTGRYTAPIVSVDTVVPVTVTSTAQPLISSTFEFTVKAVSVIVTDAPASLPKKTNYQFEADTLHDFPDGGVTWQVIGTPFYVGTIDATSGYYTSPNNKTDAYVEVIATSVTNPEISSLITFQINEPQVINNTGNGNGNGNGKGKGKNKNKGNNGNGNGNGNPQGVKLFEAPDYLESGEPFNFVAEVSKYAPNQNVLWRASHGRINADGSYTAPVVSEDTYVTVRADAANARKDPVYTEAKFIVKAVDVQLTDAPATLPSSGRHTFAAQVRFDHSESGVTWRASHGSFGANGQYVAPVFSQDTLVTVTATSVAEPRNKSEMSFVVEGVRVRFDAAPAHLVSNEPFDFDEVVTFDDNQQGVTWSATHGSIDAEGQYVAPAFAEDTLVTITATTNATNEIAVSYDLVVEAIDLTLTRAPSGVISNEPFGFATLLEDEFSQAGVSWGVPEGLGILNQDGSYTAPLLSTDAFVPVTVTSNANPDVNTTVTFKAEAIDLRFTNAPASLDSWAEFPFAAELRQLYGARNTLEEGKAPEIEWSVPGELGGIDFDGVLLANSPLIDSQMPVTVTSIANPEVSSTVSLELRAIDLTITELPAGLISNEPSALAAIEQDTATPQGIYYTVTQGSVKANGEYTSPAIGKDQLTIVTATSKVNPKLRTRAGFTVKGIRVGITNAPSEVSSGEGIGLRAYTENDYLNTPLTWSVDLGEADAANQDGSAGSFTASVFGENTPTRVSATVTGTSIRNFVDITVRKVILTPPVQLTNSAQLEAGGTIDLSTLKVSGDLSGKGYTWSAELGSVQGNVYRAPRASRNITDTLRLTSNANPDFFELYPLSIAAGVALPGGGDRLDTVLSSGYLRTQQFKYTQDNRLAEEATAADPVYGYQAQRTVYDYSEDHIANENVRAPKTVVTTYQDGVTDLYSVTSSYDTRGRLSSTKREGADQTFTTSFGYHADNSSASLKLPNKSSGAYRGDYSARQFGDQIKTVTINDGTSTRTAAQYKYDHYGNVGHETLPSHFADKLASDNFADRVTHSSYNGFGQQVWSYVAGMRGSTETPVSVDVWQYYMSGALEKSFSGSSKNTRTYTYYSSGNGYGQVKSVTGLHEVQSFIYDAFGRVTSQTEKGEGKDIFATTFLNDTLDRVVKEIRPDGGQTHTHYHVSGEVQKLVTVDPKVSPRLITTTTMEPDTLGRVTKITLPKDKFTVAPSIRTIYDAYDQPIQVIDDRLEGIAVSDEDRSTLYQYDGRGNLIRELGPVLRTDEKIGVYTDNARPFTQYAYDAFSRQVEVRQLLRNSNVSRVAPKNFRKTNLPTSQAKDVNVTVTEYDAYDRPKVVTDTEGYTTEYRYDYADNPYKVTQQIWKDKDFTKSLLPSNYISSAGDTATTYTAYDAVNRVTKTRDPLGYERSQTYDLLGNPLVMTDERGVVVESNSYTPDGLLESVRQPDPSTGTPVTTEFYVYGNRRFPKDMYAAHENTEASNSTGARTSYTYDYAGRTLSTTLPADKAGKRHVVTQAFDARGNMTSLQDADDFTTSYKYDKYNRTIEEIKHPRAGTVDQTAGWDGNAPAPLTLKMSYGYDKMGNLIEETKGETGRNKLGLSTLYEYNSLGKVIAQSRPFKDIAVLQMKLMAYRLDGLKIAETTYDYSGNLDNANASSTAVSVDDTTSVTSGNIKVTEFDGRGLPVKMTSIGEYDEDFVRQEHSTLNFFDGLGRKVIRKFNGVSDIYAPLRADRGGASSDAYDSYWLYNERGNLLGKWDSRSGKNEKLNWYRYVYSPSGKEISREHEISISVPAPRGLESKSPLSIGVVAAESVGSVTSTYNKRDLLGSTTVSESNPDGYRTRGSSKITKTNYSYFKDGSKKKISVTNGRETDDQTFEYDQRGRVIKQIDSNGNAVYDVVKNEYRPGLRRGNDHREDVKATLETVYDKGSSTTTVSYANEANRGAITASETVMTVGGLVAKSASLRSSTTRTYFDVLGAPAKTETKASNSNKINAFFYTYDDTYHLLEQREAAGTNPDRFSYKYDNNGELIEEGKSYWRRDESDSSDYGRRDFIYLGRYELGSDGRRLSQSGGRYSGYNKRYDAEDRAAEFNEYDERNVLFQRKQYITSYMFFTHDPKGHQVLSSKVFLSERKGSSRNHQLSRTQSSTTYSGDSVETIRYQKEQIGNTDKLEAYIKDESFSLANAVSSELTFEIVAPFEVEESDLTLSAPTESVSDRLGVLPSDVVAPATATPDVESGEVAPPTDSGEVTAPAEDSSDTNQLNQPLVGLSALPSLSTNEGEGNAGSVDTQTLGTLPELNTLPELSTPDANQTKTEAIALETPQSALPEALNSSSTSDVVAPTSVETPLTGDADEVVAPEGTAPPTLGAAPTDSSIDVVPPAEIQPPRVPTIGGGSADPIGTVAPPVGWEAEEQEVEAQDVWRSGCGWFWQAGQQSCVDEQNARNVQEQVDQTKAEIDNILGDNPDADARKALQDLADSIVDITDTMERRRIGELALNIAKLAAESPGEGILYSRIVEAMVHDKAFSAQSINSTLTNAAYQFLLSSDIDDNSPDEIRNALNIMILHHISSPTAVSTLNLVRDMYGDSTGPSAGLGITPPQDAWTTKDFLGHYFGRTGLPVDLGWVGLGDDFENAPSVASTTEAFINEVLQGAAPGLNVSDIQKTNVTNVGEKDFTPWPALFSIGDSNLQMNASCGSNSCTFTFKIEDEFIDALDIGDRIRRPNLDLSKPYDINYEWTVRRSYEP